MQFRDILDLQTLSLKAIAKRPANAITPGKVEAALRYAPREATRAIRQRLIDALSEAGRYYIQALSPAALIEFQSALC